MYKTSITQMGAVGACCSTGFHSAGNEGLGDTRVDGRSACPDFQTMSEEDIKRALAEEKKLNFYFKPWPTADL